MLSRDGDRLVVFTQQKFIVLDLRTNRRIFEAPVLPDVLDFSKDFSYGAALGSDHAAHLWNLSTGRELPLFSNGTYQGLGVSALAFSPRDSTLALGLGDASLRLIDIPSGKEIAHLRGHRNEVSLLVFSNDGESLVSGAANSGARLWQLPMGDFYVKIGDEYADYESAAFSADGERLVTTSRSGSIDVWDTANGRSIVFDHDPGVPGYSCRFSSDTKFIVTDRTILNSKTLRMVGSLESDVIISPSASTGVSSKGELFDTETSQVLMRLFPTDKEGHVFAFSRDGSLLVGASKDGTLQAWEVPQIPDGRATSVLVCRPDRGGLLRLEPSDLGQFSGIVEPGDEQPCTRSGALSWQHWFPSR